MVYVIISPAVLTKATSADLEIVKYKFRIKTASLSCSDVGFPLGSSAVTTTVLSI